MVCDDAVVAVPVRTIATKTVRSIEPRRGSSFSASEIEARPPTRADHGRAGGRNVDIRIPLTLLQRSIRLTLARVKVKQQEDPASRVPVEVTEHAMIIRRSSARPNERRPAPAVNDRIARLQRPRHLRQSADGWDHGDYSRR
jgi:hypothetical protein